MPDEVEAAVERGRRATPAVKVIVLRGAGRSFCAGYDFGGGFHHWDDAIDDRRRVGSRQGLRRSRPRRSSAPTQKFMSVWRAPKPVIAQVHGWCVGGGSDFALCADLVIASEDARIGTPYSRMWGAYLSGMWIYRLGPDEGEGARADRPAAVRARGRRGRAHQRGGAVRASSRRRSRERGRAARARSRSSQLAAMKLDRQPGLREHGPRLDPDARPDPRRADAQHARRAAVHRARGGARASPPMVAERDGPFGDYSQAPRGRRPDPRNVIEP